MVVRFESPIPLHLVLLYRSHETCLQEFIVILKYPLDMFHGEVRFIPEAGDSGFHENLEEKILLLIIVINLYIDITHLQRVKY